MTQGFFLMTEESCECHILKNKGDFCERAEQIGGRGLSLFVLLMEKNPSHLKTLYALG